MTMNKPDKGIADRIKAPMTAFICEAPAIRQPVDVTAAGGPRDDAPAMVNK
jgi:hypothetical protein